MTPPHLLFEIPESLSPKLRWLERNALTLVRRENGRHLCVLDDENYGEGDTAEEACADLCIATGIKHWSEE